MANMTVTTEAAHIGQVWRDDVIQAQEFSFEFTPRVNRAWEKDLTHGDTIHVPRAGNLTANTKSAGTAWTPEALVDSEQTLVINKHDVAGFELEDIAAALANTDVRSVYQKRIGYALGRNVETNLAAMPQNFSQIVGTLGVELTWDNMLRAWRYLQEGGNTMDGVTWLLSPAAIAGLMKLDIVLNAMYRSGTSRALESANVGTILGAPVQQSLLTRAPASGQSEGAVFKKEAISLVMAKSPTIVTEYIAKELAWVVGGHQIYGYVEVDRYGESPANVTSSDDWAVLLRTIG